MKTLELSPLQKKMIGDIAKMKIKPGAVHNVPKGANIVQPRPAGMYTTIPAGDGNMYTYTKDGFHTYDYGGKTYGIKVDDTGDVMMKDFLTYLSRKTAPTTLTNEWDTLEYKMNNMLNRLKKDFPKLKDITIREQPEKNQMYIRVHYDTSYYEVVMPEKLYKMHADRETVVESEIRIFLNNNFGKKKAKMTAKQKAVKNEWSL